MPTLRKKSYPNGDIAYLWKEFSTFKKIKNYNTRVDLYYERETPTNYRAEMYDHYPLLRIYEAERYSEKFNYEKYLLDIIDKEIEYQEEQEKRRNNFGYEFIRKQKIKMISQKRAKDVVYDISKSNYWEWFVTLTFNPEGVDSRYDYQDVAEKLKSWTEKTRKQAKKKGYKEDLKYILTIDQHKDGAYHYHGLLSGLPIERFIDSGLIDKKGRIIYNIEGCNIGWTTATKISDPRKCASYLVKYLTKKLDVPKGKKKYWTTQNLSRPIISFEESNMPLEKHIKLIHKLENIQYYNTKKEIQYKEYKNTYEYASIEISELQKTEVQIKQNSEILEKNYYQKRYQKILEKVEIPYEFNQLNLYQYIPRIFNNYDNKKNL